MATGSFDASEERSHYAAPMEGESMLRVMEAPEKLRSLASGGS
jgi:hypothetical protein